MATTSEQLKRMQREIEILKKKVVRLERRESGKRQVERPRKSTGSRERKGSASERERASGALQAAGLVSEPTEYERQLVAEWRQVPEPERNQLVEQFRNMELDRPLSDLIIEQRR
jgi:hypothetical protein